MCDNNTTDYAVKKPIKALPKIVIKKNKIVVINGENKKEPKKNYPHSEIYGHSVIYENRVDEYFTGPPQARISIVNKLNVVNNCGNRTKSFVTMRGSLLQEITSDKITRLIGQKNYDTVLSALCSVIDQGLKVRSIVALLGEVESQDLSTQTTETFSNKKMENKCCQTEENCIDLIMKWKKSRPARLRRSVLTPYVVKDIPQLNKIVVDVKLEKFRKPIKVQIDSPPPVRSDEMEQPLPVLHLNEDSNCSTLSTLTNISNSVLYNADELMKAIGMHTEETSTILPDSTPTTMPDVAPVIGDSQQVIRMKEEDKFHYASPEILRSLNDVDRKNLLMYQAYIDWKYCMEEDVDGNLPIHMAVINNDLDLLRRQCWVLKKRNMSLDTPAQNLTALQMSLRQLSPKYTKILLRYGADPLITDDEYRTVLHLAAEFRTEHASLVIDHCKSCARSIMENHDSLWSEEYNSKSDEELGVILLEHMCSLFDRNGYTPLMLASKLGKYNNVDILLQASKKSVNVQMPNSGDTALYLAVAEAQIYSINNLSNKSVVADHFKKTIQILIENGADPAINNYCNSNVDNLLSDFNNQEMSTLVSGIIVVNKHFSKVGQKNVGEIMLIKDKSGNIGVTSLRKRETVDVVYKERAKRNRTATGYGIADHLPKKVVVDVAKLVKKPEGTKNDNIDKDEPEKIDTENDESETESDDSSDQGDDLEKIDTVIDKTPNLSDELDENPQFISDEPSTSETIIIDDNSSENDYVIKKDESSTENYVLAQKVTVVEKSESFINRTGKIPNVVVLANNKLLFSQSNTPIILKDLLKRKITPKIMKEPVNKLKYIIRKDTLKQKDTVEVVDPKQKEKVDTKEIVDNVTKKLPIADVDKTVEPKTNPILSTQSYIRYLNLNKNDVPNVPILVNKIVNNDESLNVEQNQNFKRKCVITEAGTSKKRIKP